MKSRKGRYVFFASAVLCGIILAFLAAGAFSVLKVQGSSMEPAVKSGDYVLINRMAFFFGQPQEGDLVAFSCNVYSEDGEGSTLIKRVVATEGDSVEIREGSLYVNGSVYDEYASSPVYLEPMERITIEKDAVFVLSDDRSSVLDSRDQAVGQLNIAELEGKVCFK